MKHGTGCAGPRGDSVISWLSGLMRESAILPHVTVHFRQCGGQAAHSLDHQDSVVGPEAAGPLHLLEAVELHVRAVEKLMSTLPPTAAVTGKSTASENRISGRI